MGAGPLTGDDGMIFDEVRHREPTRMKRPDHDPRFACLACQTPRPDDLPIFLDLAPADQIERHALSDTSVELGGILLGKECVDPTTGEHFVWIAQAIEAKHYANTRASFTYTHDSWEEITRERDRLYPDLDVVGWYHTHPDFGIFLSHHDLFIHQNFFSQPLQVAYVVDPIQGTRGFFRWSDDKMVQVGGFHVRAPRSERPALVRLVDELENLTGDAEPAGGSLSPRLEAELIKMLNRPAHSSFGDHSSTSVFLGFLGGLLLAAILAVGIGLAVLGGRLANQNETLAALQERVDEDSAGRRLALDALREKIGADAPSQFVERYERAAEERDDAQKRLAAERSISETLAMRTKELETRAEALAADLETARADLKKLEAEAEKTAALQKRLDELEQTTAEQKRALDDQRPIVESVEGERVEALLSSLNLHRLIAYAGGLASVLLALAAAFLYYRAIPTPNPAPSDAEPRRIT